MADNIFVNTTLYKRIYLKPEYLNKNFEKNIGSLLEDEIGDKCISEGYIKKDSINVIKRSVGQSFGNTFAGHIGFDVIYSAEVCNPVNGNIIKAKIIRVNKLGIQAEEGPLSIIIAKEYHENKDLFKDLHIEDEIEVLVIGKRYSLNDNKIEIIGKLAHDKTKKKIKLNKKKEIDVEVEPTELEKIEEISEEGSVEEIDIEEEDEDEEGDEDYLEDSENETKNVSI